MGLVNKVCPRKEMYREAVSMVSDIADNPSWQVMETKRMIHQHYLEPNLAAIIEEENRVFAAARKTAAHIAFLAAFKEKREPSYH